LGKVGAGDTEMVGGGGWTVSDGDAIISANSIRANDSDTGATLTATANTDTITVLAGGNLQLGESVVIALKGTKGAALGAIVLKKGVDGKDPAMLTFGEDAAVKTAKSDTDDSSLGDTHLSAGEGVEVKGGDGSDHSLSYIKYTSSTDAFVTADDQDDGTINGDTPTE
jgi:hypothetical protein